MKIPQPWFIYAFLSAIFAALTTILAKVGVQNVNSNVATAIRTVVILLFTAAIVAATGQASSLAGMSRKALLFIVLSGVATGLSWLCYFRALQLGNASLVAPVDKSSLVFIIVFSWALLGEPLTLKSILAVALVSAGTIVLAL